MYGRGFLPFTEYLALTFLIVLGTLGLLVNILLLAAICMRSSKKFRYYFFVLFNMAIVDTTCSFLTILILPTYTVSKGYLLYVTFGFCGYFGPYVCQLTYTIMACLYSYIPWLILASIALRCYLLRKSNPKNRFLFAIFLLAFAAPTIFQVCISMMAFNAIQFGQVDSKKLLQDVFPTWDFSNLTTFFLPISEDWKVIWVNYLVSYPSYPIFFISIGILAHTYYSIGKMTYLSETSKDMHRSFIYALSLQTFTFPLSVFKSLLFTSRLVSASTSFQDVCLGHFGFILMELIPLVNACSHLYFVKTYRAFVKYIIARLQGKTVQTLPITVLTNQPSLENSR